METTRAFIDIWNRTEEVSRVPVNHVKSLSSDGSFVGLWSKWFWNFIAPYDLVYTVQLSTIHILSWNHLGRGDISLWDHYS